MKVVTKFFLIVIHGGLVIAVFVAIGLAVQGKTQPATTLAILSGMTVMALAPWWIFRFAKYSAETREKIKKGVDVVSLASVAMFIGIWIWVEIWGESPRAPGHISLESKIIVWNGAPFVFSGNWLIVRYANVLAKKFPSLLSRRLPDGSLKQGRLFYFVVIPIGVLVFLQKATEILVWLLDTPSAHK